MGEVSKYPWEGASLLLSAQQGWFFSTQKLELCDLSDFLGFLVRHAMVERKTTTPLSRGSTWSIPKSYEMAQSPVCRFKLWLGKKGGHTVPSTGHGAS